MNHFTNRAGVRIYYRAVADTLGDQPVYRFELAPGEPVNWHRSSAFFWTEREAMNTARDIARETARFDQFKIRYAELPPARPRRPLAAPAPAEPARPAIPNLRPAAPIRQYKDD